MSDKYYSEPTEAAALRAWVTWQMLRGAGWAALVVVSIGVILLAIWCVSQVLDPRSKENPSPYGMLQSVPVSDVA